MLKFATAALALALAFTATGAAAEEYPPAPAGVFLTDPTPNRGSTVTLTVRGFAPDSTVEFWLHSEPTFLGTALAGSDGSASLTVRIPANVPAGRHTLRVTGVGPDGTPMEMATSLVVGSAAAPAAAPAGRAEPLARTGENHQLLVRAAIGLLAAGAVAVATARRRITAAAG